MKPKDYLLQLYEMTKHIQKLRREYKEMIDKATRITTYLNPMKVQTSKSHDSMENAVVIAADISRTIESATWDYYLKQNMIVNQIHQLDNVKYVKILFKHYVQFKDLKQVAKEMDIAHPYAKELNVKALKAFGKKFPEVLEAKGEQADE